MPEYCADGGPDTGHYYADQDTGEYRIFCSCGHLDPFAPSEDGGALAPALAPGDNPPF